MQTTARTSPLAAGRARRSALPLGPDDDWFVSDRNATIGANEKTMRVREGLGVPSIDVNGRELGYSHADGTSGLTFVFVNALTGSAAMWEAAVAPALRERGHGTLTFDLPGQPASPLPTEVPIHAVDLAAATGGIVTALAPARPVYVGLSIGGLFAVQAHLEGATGAGFVLVNTLRKADARLHWVNDAVLRLAELGGGRLLRDAYGPLLFGLPWLQANRDGALNAEPYQGLGEDAAERKLLAAGRGADWDVPYERITAPVVVLTGLQDRLFLDRANLAELAGRFPDAVRQDVPDAAHLLPVEKPAAVVAACLAVAGRIGRP